MRRRRSWNRWDAMERRLKVAALESLGLGLTRREVAERLGVSLSTVARARRYWRHRGRPPEAPAPPRP